jgi:hypothetical protein
VVTSLRDRLAEGRGNPALARRCCSVRATTHQVHVLLSYVHLAAKDVQRAYILQLLAQLQTTQRCFSTAVGRWAQKHAGSPSVQVGPAQYTLGGWSTVIRQGVVPLAACRIFCEDLAPPLAPRLPHLLAGLHALVHDGVVLRVGPFLLGHRSCRTGKLVLGTSNSGCSLNAAEVVLQPQHAS